MCSCIKIAKIECMSVVALYFPFWDGSFSSVSALPPVCSNHND